MLTVNTAQLVAGTVTMIGVAVAVLLRYLGFAKGDKIRLPIDTTKTYAHLSHGKVNYRLRGHGKNIVVLVHGFSTPSPVFDEVQEGLVKRGHTVLTFDNYGRGDTVAPDVPNNAALFISQIAELFYALDITQAVDIVGYSMGGAIATAFATTYPKKVKNMVLLSPAGLPVAMSPVVATLLRVPLLGEVIFKFVGLKAMITSADQEYTHPENNSDNIKKIKGLVGSCGEQHSGYIRSLYSTLLHFPMQTMTEEFKTVGNNKTPTLLIWGRNDGVCPYKNAQIMLDLIGKGASLYTIDGGHCFPLEYPDETVRAIHAFLVQ